MAFLKRGTLSRIKLVYTSTNPLLIIVLAVCAGGIVGYSQISNGDVDCATYNAVSSVPAGYGVPYDVFSTTKSLVVKATCDTTSATIAAGAVGDGKLVYKYGYQWRNGSWQRYTFSGSEAGSWIQGVATARLSRTAAEMGSVNYVVAYTCQSINNAWKCGCRDTQCTTGMWQLQGFKKISQSLPSEDGIWGDYNELMLARLSTIAAPPGTPVTITGAGFSTTGNTVVVGNRTLKGIAASSKHGLTFTIPNDMPTGVAEIKVINEKGTATGSALMVTTPGAQQPTVTSITPASGGHGTKVTIQGTNFTPTDNILITGYGNSIQHIPSSDGKTLVVTLLPFPNNPEMQKDGTAAAFGKFYNFHMYVINKNGVSPIPVVFKATY